MTINVGINGFGRMGRLSFRAAFSHPDIKFVHINDPAADAATMAHLINFDSVHGRWQHQAQHSGSALNIEGSSITCSQNEHIHETDWSACDMVIEASGKIKTTRLLQLYLDQGVKRVVVTAPINEDNILNIVMGVNQHLYDPSIHPIVTAASCTTNCLAPVIKVLQEKIGIKHGSMTTIHDITNTQTILDAPHSDLRRARACGISLIPTTTGSATAITHIFPELKGKLNGHAIRVPLANASITDCVFELEKDTSAEELNSLFKAASNNELQGILGYEERPLVSIDYKTDPRSAIIDALSTMVINGTQAKIYAWYDNEWGYANRVVDLLLMIAKKDGLAP